jgi:hypothetical protein
MTHLTLGSYLASLRLTPTADEMCELMDAFPDPNALYPIVELQTTVNEIVPF